VDLSNWRSTLFTVIVELLLQSEKPFVLRISVPNAPDSNASTVTLDLCKFHISKCEFDSRSGVDLWNLLSYYSNKQMWIVEVLW
jgi:hypothetical protein